MTLGTAIAPLVRGIVVLTILLLLGAAAASAQTTITITTETWWSGITTGSGPGGLPSAADTIIVKNNAKVVVDAAGCVCAALRLGVATGGNHGAGTLAYWNNGALTVGTPIVVGDAAGGGVGGSIIIDRIDTYLRCPGVVDANPGSTSLSMSNSSTLELTAAGSLPVLGTTNYMGLTLNGAAFTLTDSIMIYADLKLTNNASLDMGSNTADGDMDSLIVEAGSALTVGAVLPRWFMVYAFDPASEVIYNGGAQNVAAATYGKLTLSGTGTKTIITPFTTTGLFTIDGVTADFGGNDPTINGDVTNVGGALTNAGTVHVYGTAHQTFTGVTAFNRFSMNNPAGATIDSASIADIWLDAGILEVTGKITVANFNTWNDTSYVKGRVCVERASAGSAYFPVGDGGLAYTSAYYPAAGWMTVSTVPGVPTDIVDPNAVLPRRWFVETDLASPSLTFSYPGSEVLGDETLYKAAIRQGTAWTIVGSSANTTEHSVNTGPVPISGGVGEFAVGTIAALPIQLTGVSGRVEGSSVTLTWSTLTETNNYGFYIERRKEGASVYETVSGLIAGAGTTLEEQQYAWSDEHAPSGTWYYRLKQVDLDGTTSWSEEITIVISGALGVTENKPLVYALGQNYPNPFNPRTSISYALPEESFVTLSVYNMLGQQVATLVNEKQPAGEYTAMWDAVNVPSGLYIYRIQANTFTEVRKMLLVR